MFPQNEKPQEPIGLQGPGLRFSKKDLLTLLDKPLKELVEKEVNLDCEQEKILQYRQMRRTHLYFEGKQNIAPQWLGTGFADFASVGSPVSENLLLEPASGVFDYVFNIVRGDTLKAVAVMGKAPKVKAVADDPESDEGEQQATLADVVAADLHQKWELDQRVQETGLILWIYSPAFAWTHYTADGSKYGYTEEPVIEIEDTDIGGQYRCSGCGASADEEEVKDNAGNCPQCGGPLGDTDFVTQKVPLPKQVGTKRYENGTVELDIFSAMEVSISFYAEKEGELEYLLLERDMPKGKLVSQYPKLRKKIDSEMDGGSTAAKQTGVEVRGSAASPTGVRFPHPNLWRYSLLWIKPSLYNLVKGSVPDKLGSPTTKTLTELLRENFPDGMRLDIVDGEFMDFLPSNLQEEWKICKPTVSKKLMSDPLITDGLPIQDMFNDSMNMAEETFSRGVPGTIVSNELLDRESMENRPPAVANMIWTKPGAAGTDISKQIVDLPMAQLSPQMMPFIQGARELGREVYGVNRSIYGGYDPTEKTAKQAIIEKQMALMQLSLPYDNIRKFVEGFTLNAVRQMAKYGTGEIRVASDEGMLGSYSRTAQISELKTEGYHFEADEGMPETFAEQRDTIKDIMTNAPSIATAVGYDSPFNAGRMQRYLGTPGMFSPVEAAREKVRKSIRALLQGQNVAVDPFDDHVIMTSLCQAWMISNEGMQQQDQNPNFQNVVNWWMQHKIAAAPPPAPGGPAGPPPAPEPPKGGKNAGQPAAANTSIAGPPAPVNSAPIGIPGQPTVQ